MSGDKDDVPEFWTDEQQQAYTDAALFVYRYDQSERLLSDREVLRSLSESTQAYAQNSAERRGENAAKVLMDELYEYGVLRYGNETDEVVLGFLGNVLVQNYLRREEN
jgi:hypothetical protein